MFDNKLPLDLDWNQINDFIRNTKLYKKILSNNWIELDSINRYSISDKTIEFFGCLHEDLVQSYQKAFAFDENGMEDRFEENRILWENLHIKYNRIDEDLLKKIYSNYLIEDR